MIVYDLCCPNVHRFEGWFASSDEFARQQLRGLLTCPTCGSADVTRAPTAPNLARKANQQPPAPTTPAAAPAQQSNAPLPPEAAAALRALAQIQAEALKASTWVGSTFADKARAMHYGESPAAPIHGQTTPQEARALVEEGVDIAPILFPIAPPGTTN
jgi:hypothetical protein